RRPVRRLSRSSKGRSGAGGPLARGEGSEDWCPKEGRDFVLSRAADRAGRCGGGPPARRGGAGGWWAEGRGVFSFYGLVRCAAAATAPRRCPKEHGISVEHRIAVKKADAASGG